MAAELSAARGTRDFAERKKIMRDRVAAVIRQKLELYGFDALETPALENWGVLSAKFAGGEDILKECYRLKDQGERELGLRYDLTVPLCRFVAGNPTLAKPFKRYAIGPVWRDGPLKAGRYREFWQADADVVGAAGQPAEAELLALACDVLSGLGLEFEIRVNNRQVMEALLDEAGVPGDKREKTILVVDKLAKIGEEGVRQELKAIGVDAENVFSLIKTGTEGLGALAERLSTQSGKNGVEELNKLFTLCREYGVSDKVVFDASLARGLNYYTGAVFEAFLKNSVITSSVAAGGRYDDLVGKFVAEAGGPDERVPAAGISFGLDVLCDALLKDAEKWAPANTVAKVFVVPIGDFPPCIPLLNKLRTAGIATGIDVSGRSISKNLEFAAKKGFPFVIIVGKKELDAGKVRLRDMKTGEEKLVTPDEAARALA